MVIQRSQRNGYDYAARQTGARIVEIEGTTPALEAAISERTACVLFFAGAHFAADASRGSGDRGRAPARRPGHRRRGGADSSVSTLWHFTAELGADAAILSGGKGLRGPASSGLILGRSEIIEGCRANGNPNHAIGRPLKVGKEEIVGLLAAVEWALEQDEPRVSPATRRP